MQLEWKFLHSLTCQFHAFTSALNSVTFIKHLLSRQTESARDHKFHSGYAHSSISHIGVAPASNSRVNIERESGASQSLRFSRMRSKMRLCLFLQKEMKRSAHFSNFESRLYLLALFSANLRKSILF